MKTFVLFIAASLLLFVFFESCKTSRGGWFGKKSGHEAYADGLESAGLENTAMGKLWFNAAHKSLSQPLSISLPHRETGYFAAEQPRATGYRFTAKRGEKLLITVATTPASGSLLFIELWRPPRNNNKAQLLEVADTLTRQLEYEVEEDTGFLVRLQPELLKGIEYTITITTQPSLAFPVQRSAHPRVISFWGAERDAGRRDHEGIDIAAPRLTPVVAAANGRVTSVGENNLGGKVIFMRPGGKNYNLYYAHLDSQIVQTGQSVKEGNVLGLLGNTGNARTTIPHLHFGIYTPAGAIDPFPFINPDKITIPAITASLKHLNSFVRSRAIFPVYTDISLATDSPEKLPASSVMQVVGATGKWYRVLLPDEREVFVDHDMVTVAAIRQSTTNKETRLLVAPGSFSPARTIIPPEKQINMLGKYGEYWFVKYEEEKGWISE